MKSLFEHPLFRVICVVSIMLNAVFIGLLASKWGPLARKPSVRDTVSLTLDRYFASLPEPARSKFSESFESRRAEIMPSLTHLLETRRRLYRVLRRDPLDYDNTAAILEELRQANLVAQEPLHQVLIDTAAALPPQDRPRLLHLDYGFSENWRENFGLTEPGTEDNAAPQR